MEQFQNKNFRKNKKIAVIGAGVSSLSFLYKFNNKPTDKLSYSIDLFERSRGLSGRASTRQTEGFIYDNGANYISSTNQRIINTITKELDTSELISIEKWIYPFDRSSVINFDKKEAEGHNKLIKYNYKSGINKIGQLLYEKTNKEYLKTHFSFNVEKVTLSEEGWEIHSKESKHGFYDYIVFGTPSFNAAKVLSNSEFKIKEDEEFFKSYTLKKLEEVEYKKIYSLAIAFEKEQADAQNIDLNLNQNNYYALINSDRQHAVSWISIENEKEGRIPKGKENSLCLIVQMSEEFSEKYQNEDINLTTKKILEEVEKIIPQIKNTKIIFNNLKLWRIALPKNSIDESLIEDMKKRNFFIIGDSLIGKGRVDGAMLTGFELNDYFNKI
jgi:renalase